MLQFGVQWSSILEGEKYTTIGMEMTHRIPILIVLCFTI